MKVFENFWVLQLEIIRGVQASRPASQLAHHPAALSQTLRNREVWKGVAGAGFEPASSYTQDELADIILCPTENKRIYIVMIHFPSIMHVNVKPEKVNKDPHNLNYVLLKTEVEDINGYLFIKAIKKEEVYFIKICGLI